MGQFGIYDFGLTAEQEERARQLHQQSVIIDTLFQGPCSHHSFSDEMVEQLKEEFEQHHDAQKGL